MKTKLAFLIVLLALVSSPADARHHHHHHPGPPPPPPPMHYHHRHHVGPLVPFMVGAMVGTTVWAATQPATPIVAPAPVVTYTPVPKYYIRNPDGSLTPVY